MLFRSNPIYARQANEIESVAKTVAEQSRTIEAFKAERDKLGMFKGKEKEEYRTVTWQRLQNREMKSGPHLMSEQTGNISFQQDRVPR